MLIRFNLNITAIPDFFNTPMVIPFFVFFKYTISNCDPYQMYILKIRKKGWTLEYFILKFITIINKYVWYI